MQDITPPQRGQLRPTPRPVDMGVRARDMMIRRVTTVTVTPEATVTTQEEDIVFAEPQIQPQIVDAPVAALPKPKRPFAKRFLTRRFLLAAAACIVLAATTYIGIDTWKTNTAVKAELNTSGRAASVDNVASEGSDQTVPTKDVLGEYAVAADQPRALYINKLSIAARILPMGVNADSSVQAPRNIFDAGWYVSSAKPGTDGATFIDGHASGVSREGLFAYLDTLKEGDEISIEKGNSDRITYVVRHVEIIGLDQVDMNTMLKPYGNATKGLNIMTCTGKWVEATKTYDHRVLIFAEQVS